MDRKYAISITLMLALITLLTGITLASSGVNADDSTVSTVTVSVDVACSLTSTEDTSHTASIPNGTYRADIGTTTLKVLCNDSGGFAIYAIGYSGLEFGNNKMLATVDGNLAPTYDIVTGTSQNGDTSNWAMKLNKVTDTTTSYNPGNLTINNSFDAYHAVPTNYTKVATYNSVTDAILGSKLTTTYAAYIAGTQPAGTYEGKVKYTLVHPSTETPLQPQTPTAGCINYFANASNAVGTMGCQSATDNSTITLLASNFSRDGYGFAGWSDAYDYDTNQNAHFYGPQETITVPEGTTANGLALYAVWIKSQGSLQDTTKVSVLCGTGAGSLTIAPTDGTADLTSVSALTDARDNQTYAIAKLADGNCWMIENLRLDNIAELTMTNTNNPLNDGTNVTLKHNYTDTNTFNTLSATSAVAYNVDTAPEGWCQSSSADCDDQSRLRTDNTANRATGNPNTNSDSMYSYGNYYNWYSATAGNGTYGYGTNNNSVDGDLCPAGWHLPIGGSSANATNSDFWKYGVAVMGSAPSNNGYYRSSETNVSGDTATKALRKYPNNYLYSGDVSGGSLYDRGRYGFYWSSTAWDINYAYNLYLNSSSVTPGTGNEYYKYFGRAVRCIAQ